jgi:hypothetical protein
MSVSPGVGVFSFIVPPTVMALVPAESSRSFT